VRQLAASLAVEWAKHNIQVDCISPGYMLTNLRVLRSPVFSAVVLMWLQDTPNRGRKPRAEGEWTSLIAAGQMGNFPEDLMGPVTSLLSDAVRYTTRAYLRG
jgi:NAD(P)-dependent dehydrogenase (short-subunit alcohol dehydrogenase family)